jgi:hypothetical protein
MTLPRHIFFSWQSDTPNPVGRTMIENCLKRALATLKTGVEVDAAQRDLAVDRDTLDVPGSPPIMEIILPKIDRAAVFLSDLTYVTERSGGGRCPNPNVLIEHGWALKALSWRRVIGVMNTAMGHPDDYELPFDLRHARRPIFYHCPPDADASTRARARDELAKQLASALKAILGDQPVLAATQSAAPVEPHPHDVTLLERVHRQLPVALRRFLHQHSFGTPFVVAELDPLHEMNEDWVGAAYEFHDSVLQASFTDLRRAAKEFGELIGQRIYPMDRNPKFGWPKTDIDVARGVQPDTLEAIRTMNVKATQLSAAIDSFDRVARDRIRVAFSEHNESVRVSKNDDREEGAFVAMQELAFDAHRGALPEIVRRPRLTLRIVPLAAMEGRRLDPRLITKLQLRFPPSPHDRVQTDSDGKQWWSCAVPQPHPGMNPETSWRMRLVRPGCLEYQVTIGHRIDSDQDMLVDGRHLEGVIVGIWSAWPQLLLIWGLADQRSSPFPSTAWRT